VMSSRSMNVATQTASSVHHLRSMSDQRLVTSLGCLICMTDRDADM
jgi:hypothetical protein